MARGVVRRMPMPTGLRKARSMVAMPASVPSARRTPPRHFMTVYEPRVVGAVRQCRRRQSSAVTANSLPGSRAPRGADRARHVQQVRDDPAYLACASAAPTMPGFGGAAAHRVERVREAARATASSGQCRPRSCCRCCGRPARDDAGDRRVADEVQVAGDFRHNVSIADRRSVARRAPIADAREPGCAPRRADERFFRGAIRRARPKPAGRRAPATDGDSAHRYQRVARSSWWRAGWSCRGRAPIAGDGLDGTVAVHHVGAAAAVRCRSMKPRQHRPFINRAGGHSRTVERGDATVGAGHEHAAQPALRRQDAAGDADGRGGSSGR